ncbi:MAG TPA: methyl-accepting chemotaxis protein [bacterium]|nr:methyl-accepting chemotaxis protein [bacterium]
MRLKTKLILASVALGVLPVSVVSYRGHQQIDATFATVMDSAAQALQEQVRAKLTATRELARRSIEDYFRTARDQMVTFAQDGMVVEAMRGFRGAYAQYLEERSFGEDDVARMRTELASYYDGEFAAEYRRCNPQEEPATHAWLRSLDPTGIALQHAYLRANPNPLGEKLRLERPVGDTSHYAALHARIQPLLRDYMERFGYYDIFLIEPEQGTVVYSVCKELDFATSLRQGAYRDTSFARAFERASQGRRGSCVHEDFERYAPSCAIPASFLASPIYDGGELIGVACFQMRLDRITAVASVRAGMGETGEVYMVGRDHLMRSDSYRDPEHRSVAASFRHPDEGAVRTTGVTRALQGEATVAEEENYAGMTVVGAYAPVEIGEHIWAIACEVETREAYGAITALEDAADEHLAAMFVESLWLVLLVIGVVAVFGTLAARRLSVALTRMRDAATAIADKDLTGTRLDAEGRDEVAELGHAIDAIGDSLRGVLQQVQHGVGEIAAGTTEVKSTSMGLANGSQDQVEKVSSIQETVGRLNEQAQANADRAGQAVQISAAASRSTDVGRREMGRMREAMQAIADSSAEISNVIKVIDDIAFQTNLLALNAAIEAEGAGEHGKRFAVVSEEVRKLAERSATAARETAAMIRESSQRVATGVELAGTVEQSLGETMQGIERVDGILKEIDSGSREQSSEVAQVRDAVAVLESLGHQSAAGSEQLSAAAARSSTLSASLLSMVEQFRLPSE